MTRLGSAARRRGCLVLLVLLSLGSIARGQDADRDREDAAAALYQQGITAFKSGRFKRSLTLLSRAREHARSASLAAKIDLHLGINHAILSDEPAARRAFGSALRLQPTLDLDYFRYKPAIVDLFRQVRSTIRGTLVIEGDQAGASVSVDGRRVGTLPLRIEVAVGRHQVVVSDAEGQRVLARPVVIAAASSTRLVAGRPGTRQIAARVAARQPDDRGRRRARGSRRSHPRDRRRPRLWTWVAASGAAVALGVGIGFNIAAVSDHDEYETTDDRGRFFELADRIPDRLAVANAMYVTSGVLAAGAVTLYFIEARWRTRRREARLTPLLGPRAIGVRGSF